MKNEEFYDFWNPQLKVSRLFDIYLRFMCYVKIWKYIIAICSLVLRRGFLIRWAILVYKFVTCKYNFNKSCWISSWYNLRKFGIYNYRFFWVKLEKHLCIFIDSSWVSQLQRNEKLFYICRALVSYNWRVISNNNNDMHNNQ